LRSEFSRWSTLLSFTTSFTTSVTSLTVAALSATTTTSTKGLALALTLTTHHSTRRSVGSLLLDVRSWDNLSWEMEPLAEVVETLRSESVVVVLPGELSLDITPGSERLASLDDEEILGVDIWVLWQVVRLLCL
jgi:hypothetical protein